MCIKESGIWIHYIHMPHPNPILHLATSEVPGSPGMFSSIMDTVSRGVTFATGGAVAKPPTARSEEVSVNARSASFEPCVPQMLTLHQCLDEDLTSCQKVFDDLIRCRYQHLPRNKPSATSA